VELPDRFWSMISPLPYTGCWIWTGSRYPVGYGKVHWQGKKQGAHRVVYTLLVGPIPDGLVIDHLCRVRACVNPQHLEAVTFRENVLRGESPSVVAGRTGYCKKGHRLGGDNVHPSVAARGKQDCRTCGNERSAYWKRIYKEQAKR
jgi:hypothetical protein